MIQKGLVHKSNLFENQTCAVRFLFTKKSQLFMNQITLVVLYAYDSLKRIKKKSFMIRTTLLVLFLDSLKTTSLKESFAHESNHTCCVILHVFDSREPDLKINK